MSGARHAFALVGGRLFTGLRDVTSDLGALDSAGQWVVVLPFEGAPICARFDVVGPAKPLETAPWVGPERAAWVSSLDRTAFVAGVETIRRAIHAGSVYQVNLTRLLSAPLSDRDADVAALGAALAQGNPAPFSAIVRIPSHGVHIASASPERFLSIRGRAIRSSPIKGTAPSPRELLPKDRAENVMIVDLVRNDLGRVCETGSVEVPSLCALEHHPGLVHLVSTVEGRLRRDAGWPEAIAATFPPGSVTGAPKRAALSLIRALEPVSRSYYCGAIGWVDAEKRHGELNVAIRTFFVHDGALCFGTGGGITYDSSPEGEWEETELKARRLLSIASPR